MAEFNTNARRKIEARLRNHFFEAEAQERPDFADTITRSVERVIKVAKAGDGQPFDYDDLEAVQADGVVLQGLYALSLVDDATAARWSLRLGRFFTALADAMPKGNLDAKLADVMTEDQARAIWKATAK